jgi:hypothetical protein
MKFIKLSNRLISISKITSIHHSDNKYFIDLSKFSQRILSNQET